MMNWWEGFLLLVVLIVGPSLALTLFFYYRVLYRQKKGKDQKIVYCQKFWTIPNIITLLGIGAIFLSCFYFWQKQYLSGFIFLFLSAFSDLADGWAAKHFNQRTKVGEILDPLRDRLLLAGGIFIIWPILNWSEFLVRFWFFILILAELFIGLVNLVGKKMDLKTKVHWAGKARQAGHFLLIIILISQYFLGKVVFLDSQILAVMALISGGALSFYILQFFRGFLKNYGKIVNDFFFLFEF